jgi:D-alanine-D-alanine ligase
MKIVVAAGGLSPERDVSLSSGSLIANALIDAGYKVCLADLYTGV